MPIDPRAHASERLTAPAPLSHVSRRALKRVKNPVPAPTSCRYCTGPVHLVCNSEIYNGRSYGDWPYIYLCYGCRAYVGLHPDTDVPLGTLANEALRTARNRSKAIFHKYLSDNGIGRSQAYRWLAEQMQIDVGFCHFGWFETFDCARAEAIVKSALSQASAACAPTHTR